MVAINNFKEKYWRSRKQLQSWMSDTLYVLIYNIDLMGRIKLEYKIERW